VLRNQELLNKPSTISIHGISVRGTLQAFSGKLLTSNADEHLSKGLGSYKQVKHFIKLYKVMERSHTRAGTWILNPVLS